MMPRNHGRWLAALAGAVLPGLALAAGLGAGPPGFGPGGPPGFGSAPPPGFGSAPPPGPGACPPLGPATGVPTAEPDLPPPVGLRVVREADVTPGATCCVRPQLVKAGDTLFIGYTELSTPRSRKLVQLDADFRPTQVFALATDGGEPTDMRWAGGADGWLWCAYETAETGPRPDGNAPPASGPPRPAPTTLNLASYRFASGALSPGILEQRIARGAVLAPPWSIPQAGEEITDDPTPFLFRDALVLGTRRFERAVLPLRSFSPAGVRGAVVELDLSALFPNRSLSVYSLVSIEGRPWLLVGAETPPRSMNPAGDIYAVPLQQDLSRADGAAVPLVATPQFETYVSGARASGGKLVLVHTVNDLSSPGRFQGHLRVFDTTKGFAPLGSAVVNITAGGVQLDNHLSVELLGERIVVAYYTAQGRLMVREYALDGP